MAKRIKRNRAEYNWEKYVRKECEKISRQCAYVFFSGNKIIYVQLCKEIPDEIAASIANTYISSGKLTPGDLVVKIKGLSSEMDVEPIMYSADEWVEKTTYVNGWTITEYAPEYSTDEIYGVRVRGKTYMV